MTRSSILHGRSHPVAAGADLHGALLGEAQEGAGPHRVPARRPHARDTDGSLTRVRPTGEQGSGILKSMSDANCFIILGDDTGNVEPGTTVEVQLLQGLV